MMQMLKCLVIAVALVAFTECTITPEQLTQLTEKFNEIRAAAGAKNMKKLIEDSTITVTMSGAATGCSPADADTNLDGIYQQATFAEALTSYDTQLKAGKNAYDTDPTATTDAVKIYRKVVNADSNKINCDTRQCDAENNAKKQQIKCVLMPAQTGGNVAVFEKGDGCSACPTGYKCESDTVKLCIVDPDAGKGGSGVSQLTQNVVLVGLAILCSMLFI